MSTTRRTLLTATAAGLVLAGCSHPRKHNAPTPVDPAVARDTALRRRAIADETSLLALSKAVLAADPASVSVLDVLIEHHTQHLNALGVSTSATTAPAAPARALTANLIATPGITTAASTAPPTASPTAAPTRSRTPAPSLGPAAATATAQATPAPARVERPTPAASTVAIATGPTIESLAAAEGQAASHRAADLRTAGRATAPLLGSLAGAGAVHVALLQTASR